MKKILYIFTVLSIAASLFTGCSKLHGKNEKITVAGLIRTDKETFILSYTDALKEAAERENVDLKLYVCNDDSAIQIDQVKTMLTSGIRYFVITPVDSSITAQITKLVNSYDGAVAFSNIPPSDEALDVGKNFFYASSAEISAGNYQAQILDEYFKKNSGRLDGKNLNILYLNGEYGHTAQIFRRQGFMDGIAKLGYKINILGEDGANWGLDSARQIISNFMATYGNEVDAIICQNDDMAIGAVEALIANGYTDDEKGKDTDGDGLIVTIPVVGVDATTVAQNYVKEKKLLGTVLQDAKGQATTALELVLQCAKVGNAKGFVTKDNVSAATVVTGESPANRNSVLDQCFLVPFVPITK